MKRKMLSRLMAASLAAIMTVGMAGCGDDAETPNTPDNQGGDTSQGGDTNQGGDDANQGNDAVSPYGDPLIDPATGQVYDLGGMEITIADWWTENPDQAPQSQFGEDQLAYRQWLQETYNFKMTQIKKYGWGEGEGAANYEFVQAATNGSTENIIYILTPLASVVTAMQQGLMYDVASLDCLDLTENKWTSSGEIYNYSIGDSVYCFYAQPTEPRNGVWFNKRLLKEAGYNEDQLYDWQASGEWTWDKFIEVMEAVQKDDNNDGTPEVYGIIGDLTQLIPAAMYSNGGSLVKKNDDGTFSLNVKSDATMEALHWVVDDVITPYWHHWDTTSDGSNYILYQDLYRNGDAIFLVEGAYAGQATAWMNGGGDPELSMKDDFGFVMFPKGPRANDYASNSSNNPVAIPSSYSADQAWKIMFAYNLWTEPIPGYPENYADFMDNYYAGFRDTRSIDETINMMITRSVIEWHTLINGFNFREDFYYKVDKGVDIDAIVEEALTAWQTTLDEANK